MKQYIWNLFVVIDQLVNVIAGGKPDCTVSACAYVYHKTDSFWAYMLKVIDFTFFPFHGEYHCKQAFMKDNENYNKGGLFRKAAIVVLTVPFCLILAIFIAWPWYLLKKLIGR